MCKNHYSNFDINRNAVRITKVLLTNCNKQIVTIEAGIYITV
jgi:hypothetical protein